MRAITISREFGSGGDLLAQRVAEALGYHLVDKNFISTILCQYGVTEFDLEYEKQIGFWEGFDTNKTDRRGTMVRMLNQVVKTLALHGNVVILGRSGYAILTGLSDVLHVRLQAPLEDRIDRIRIEMKISREAAMALVKENDQIRTAFIESFYRVPWESPRAFDIAINSSVVPIELATNWIIEAAKLAPESAEKQAGTRQLELDPILMQAVTEKLKCTTEHA